MHTINIELPVRNTMRAFDLELTDELHERVQVLAKENEVSVSLLVAIALEDAILMPRAEIYFTA